MIPTKKSKQWIVVFILYIFFIFIALMSTRFIIGKEALRGSLPGILIISICSAILPCISGYFGRYIFFYTYSLSVILGLIYAFYIAIGDITPGWGSLTSIIGYLYTVIIGICIAFAAEIIILILRRFK